MTTNKPEVGYDLYTSFVNGGVSLHHDAICTGTFFNTEPPIHLSDYEDTQAELKKAVAALTAGRFTRCDGPAGWRPPLGKPIGTLIGRIDSLQAECDALAEALDSILRGSKLDEFGNRDNDGINSAVWHGNTKDDLRRWQEVASNALATFHNQSGDV